MNVTHRKRSHATAEVRAWISDIEQFAEFLATDSRALIDASLLVERHRLQYWDAVICTIARRHGATFLFSEDMQDGLRLGTMLIVNPFADRNETLIEDILAG